MSAAKALSLLLTVLSATVHAQESCVRSDLTSAYVMRFSDCSVHDVRGLNDHTEFKGGSCALVNAVTAVWRSQAAAVESINTLQRARVQGADVDMEISMAVRKLNVELRRQLRGIFGPGGFHTLELHPDPRDQRNALLSGFGYRIDVVWTEGVVFKKNREFTFDFTVDQTLNDNTQICVGGRCQMYNQTQQIVADSEFARPVPDCR